MKILTTTTRISKHRPDISGYMPNSGLRVFLATLKGAAVLAVIVLGLSLLTVKTTSALTSADYAGDVVSYFCTYDSTTSNPNLYGTDTWINANGSPTTNDNSVNVAYGSGYIQLDYNQAILVYNQLVSGVGPTNAQNCPYVPPPGSGLNQHASEANVTQSIHVYTTTATDSIGGGMVGTQLNGQTNSASYSANSSTRYWFTSPNDPADFTFAPPGGTFTQSQEVSVVVNWNAINTFHTGQTNQSFACVGPSNSTPTSASDWGACIPQPKTFNIQINVSACTTCTTTTTTTTATTPPSTSLSATLECNGDYSFTASDPSSPNPVNWALNGTSGSANLVNEGGNQWFYSGSGGKIVNGVNTITATSSAGGANGSSPTCTVPTGAPCPLWYGIPGGNTAAIPITLTADIPSTTTSPSGYEPYGNYTTDTYYADGNYEINSDQDQYGQTAPWTSTGEVSTNSFTLNYSSSYITDYPYDIHNPVVKYTTYYDDQKYTSASSPTYVCYYGNLYNTSQCIYGASYECPSGEYDLGSCYTYNGSGSYDSGDGLYDNCSAYSGSTYISYEYGCFTYDGSPNVAYCPYDGAYVSGANCLYNATWLGYANSASTLTTDVGDPNGSQNATVEPACYSRTFTLVPQASTSSSGYPSSVKFNDSEDPTSISVNASVVGTFGVSGPTGGDGLRIPTEATNIDTEIQVRVYHESENGTLSQVTRAGTITGTNGTSAKSTYTSSSYGYTSGNQDFTVSLSPSNVSLPPLQYGDMICIDTSVNPSAGTSVESSYPAAGDPGSWTTTGTSGIEYQQNSAGATDQWPNTPSPTVDPPGVCTVYLAAEPYLKVFGGDALAGEGTQICNPDASADIESWSQGSPSYVGAGSQLAAIAAGVINGFASAQNTAGTATSLSFASPPGADGYGGSFGSSTSYCAPDYYDNGVNGDGGANATTTNKSEGSVAAAVANGSGSYLLSGDQTIPSSGLVIPDNTQVTLYVNGSFDVGGNITYAKINGTTPAQLPALTVVATSGINVENSVNEIDGAFISEGGFQDCTDSGFVPIVNANLSVDAGSSTQSCNNQLIVKGTVLADGPLFLNRTCNSLHSAAGSELLPSYSATPVVNACSNTSITPAEATNAAEGVGYSALVWLGIPQTNQSPTVQSVTSLPPVL